MSRNDTAFNIFDMKYSLCFEERKKNKNKLKIYLSGYYYINLFETFNQISLHVYIFEMKMLCKIYCGHVVSDSV